jgi:hypothetical protein
MAPYLFQFSLRSRCTPDAGFSSGSLRDQTEAAPLPVRWSVAAFVLNNTLGSPAPFQGRRRLPVGNRSPPEGSAKPCASFDLAKQNTAKSLSSQRKE